MSDTSTAQPQRLGKYELLRSIARGGMGQVYLAKLAGELGFEKRLVIKTVRPDLASDPRFVELFAAEAKTAVGLSHPNIAPIYELGRADDGTLYAAMGWVDGPSLETLISAQQQRGEPLALGALLFIARELLDGLAHAHAGVGDRPAIVHRDITPRNVLVDRSGRVQIIDFGIAKPAASEAHSGVGSRGYMAPEQARGERVDPRADVFSVGSLLYELSTGVRAFTEEGVWMTPDLQRAPEPLRPLLERCLALDPERRYDDAVACLREVTPLLSHHAPGFASRDLAAIITDLFPEGWAEGSPALGIEGGQTPATAAPLETFETFATRLPQSAPPAAEPDPTPPASAPSRPPPPPARSLLVGLMLVILLGVGVAWVWSLRSISSSDPSSPQGPSPSPPATTAAEPVEPPDTGPGETKPMPDLPPAMGPASVELVVSIEPADAHVEVEGVALEGDAPHTLEIEPEGPRLRIEVERPGYRAQQIELDPTDLPDERELALELEPLAEGQLSVLAPSQAWAEVWVDGQRIGTTPLQDHPLVEGRHQLEVRCTAAVCDRAQTLLERKVRVRPGKTTKIVVP